MVLRASQDAIPGDPTWDGQLLQDRLEQAVLLGSLLFCMCEYARMPEGS